MVQAANFGNGNDPSNFRWLDCSWLRRILLQSQMRASSMIIANECKDVAIQTSLVEHDQVIQAFASNSSDHAFDKGTLPG